MKKKEILKTIIIIIVSVVLSSGISVYATSTYLYDSCDVSYDNTSSGLNSSNVQSSLDELYMHATDYTNIDSRVTSLESHFINNSTSVFDGNWLRLNSISNSENGLIIRDNSGTNRGVISYSPSSNILNIDSRDSSGSYGQGSLYLAGNPVKINGENIDNKYANYVHISCTGGENSSNCIEAIKNKYNSLSDGTYVGEIKAGHNAGILIFKTSGGYGTIVKFTYPTAATSKADMASISINNGTWGGWVSLH